MDSNTDSVPVTVEEVDASSLTVNLEDLVMEEEILYKLYKHIDNPEKSKTPYCHKWWRVTKSSSVLEM